MKITIEGGKEEILDFLSRVTDIDVMCNDMKQDKALGEPPEKEEP